MGNSEPDALNLCLDDVTRPLSKIVPLLSIVKNTQSPVELFHKNDQHKQSNHEIDSSDVSEVNDNSISKNFRECKPKYRKLHENIDCENMNKEYKNQINKSQQNLKSNNKNSRDIVLVNKMNNHHENENLEDRNCINDSIHSIIEILEKSLRNSSPKKETKLQEALKLQDDIEEIPNAHSDIMPENNCINQNYNEMNTTYNDTYRPDERVIQILQEQNKFLKSILFKTFSYGNDTIDGRNENKPIRINLTLNINNLGANEDGKN
ncbi:unnamed protein product [Parnassius apollo]|uniref:(apollo) hypothetical protein n=1 Tax=Parnassius apollo TaxID=110799 RepID=A0A8S3YHS7_PARAO|nr:unnamed protein product [Parnassius apollo]